MIDQYRTALRVSLIGATAIAATSATAATCPDGFPDGPIELAVGYAAGGGTDAIARSIANEMEQQQGWTVVVSNRPGAGGDLLMTAIKEMEPTGQYIGVSSTNSVTIDPVANEGVDYTWEDFDYPATAMEVVFGLVALEEKPYDTLDEFIAYAKENGRATISTSAIVLETLVRQMGEHYGVELVPIPGAGASDALQSALGGHVDATIQGSQHIEQIEAGNMVQLATLTDHRVPYAPDAPTLKEAGADLTAGAHTLMVLPKGVDPEIRTCVEEALDEAIQSEAYGQLMTNFDNEALNLGPDGAVAFISKLAASYETLFSDAE